MSASTGEKIIAVLSFVVIGLPAGLCSIVFSFGLLSRLASAPVEDIPKIIILMSVPWLISVAVAVFLLWWVVRSFWPRKASRDDQPTANG